MTQSTGGPDSAVAACGLNNLDGGRLAFSLVTCDQLSMDTRAGFDGQGFVGDIAANFTPIDELNALAGDDIADDLTSDRNVLCANVTMNFAGGADQDPARLAIRLLEIAHEFAIDAYALVDMKRTLEARGVTEHRTYALHGLAM